MKKYIKCSEHPSIQYIDIERDERFDYDTMYNIGLQKLQNLYERQQLLFPDDEVYEYDDLDFELEIGTAVEYLDDNYMIVPFSGEVYLHFSNRTKGHKIFETNFKYKVNLQTGKVHYEGEYK